MDKKLRLSLIFQAAGNAVGFLKGLKGESDKTARALGAARDKVQALQRTSRDISAFRSMETRLGGTRTALEAARAEAIRLAAAHEQTTAPTKAMSRAFEVAKARLNELSDQEQNQVRALAAMEDKLRAAGISTNALGVHERGLARDLDRANDQLAEQARRMNDVADRQRRMTAAQTRHDRTQQMAGDMSGAGFSAMTAGAALAAPGVVGVRNASELQSETTTIAQRSNMGVPESDALERRMMAAARLANQTRQETTATFNELTAQGFSVRDATAQSAAVGRAATAYREEGVEIAKTAGSLRNLNIEAGDTGRALDIMAVAGKAGNFEFGDMARAFPSLTAGAAAYGMTGLRATADLAAGLQIVRRGAGSSEEAATNLENVLQKIGSPETHRAFARAGIDVRAELERGAASGVSALETIIELSRRATGGDASRLGEFFQDAQVQKGIRPLMAATDEYRAIRAQALAAQGEVDRDFARRMNDTAEATKALRISADAASITIGRQLMPTFTKVQKFATGVTDRFNAWSTANPALAGTLTMIVAIVAGALLVFGGLAVAAAAVLGPFALLQLSLTQTGILFGPMIAGLMGTGAASAGATAGLTATGAAAGGAAIGVNALLWPILLVVAAVALFAGGAYLVYTNWGRIGSWLGKLWKGVVGVVRGGLGLVQGYLLNFTPLGLVIRNWKPITGFLGAVWDVARELVGLGVDWILLKLLQWTPLGAIVRNWTGITAFFGGLWAGAKALVAAGVDGIWRLIQRWTPLGMIISNWSGITGFLGGVWTAARAVVSTGINAIRSVLAGFQPLQAIQSAFAGVWTFFGGLPARMLEAGANAMRGLLQGIRGQRAAVQAETRNVANGMVNTTRTAHDTHSPSRVFAALGGFAMQGLALGIRGGMAGPIARTRAAAMAIAAAGVVSVAAPAIAASAPPEARTVEAALASAAGSFGARPAPDFQPIRPVADRRSERSGSAAAAAQAAPSIGALTIKIYQQPGEDMEALARRVADLMKQGTGSLAQLGDRGDDSFGEVD